MFWPKKLSVARVACASVAAIALSTAAAAGVVVKSSGPSAGEYPVGKKVGDNDRVVLESGDQVTILNKSGTRVLRGPGTFRAGARGASTRVRFAELTRQRSALRVRTGAARAGDGEVTNPNLWYVDVTQSGTLCATSLDRITMWRPKTEGEETYIIRPSDSDYHHHVTFGDGVMVRGVSDERLPLGEGNEYRISGPDGSAAVTVNFKLIEAPDGEPEALADTLIENGCTVQLDQLSQALAASAE